jgi:hypothetical protein
LLEAVEVLGIPARIWRALQPLRIGWDKVNHLFDCPATALPSSMLTPSRGPHVHAQLHHPRLHHNPLTQPCNIMQHLNPDVLVCNQLIVLLFRPLSAAFHVPFSSPTQTDNPTSQSDLQQEVGHTDGAEQSDWRGWDTHKGGAAACQKDRTAWCE